MKQLLTLLFLLCSACMFAQDVIVKKDGSTILSKVLEVGTTEVKYKQHSDMNGPTYAIAIADLVAINYQSGKRDTFSSHVDNKFAPNNQSDGVQQYNDKALLTMDKKLYPGSNKAKRLKKTAWIGASSLIIAGGVAIASGGGVSETNIIGACCLGAGCVWGTTFLIAANKAKKRYLEGVDNSTIIERCFSITNESSLTAGIDMLKDNIHNQQTLGIGIRYNF